MNKNGLKLVMAKLIIFLIKIYQYCFSLLFGSHKCRFRPTCSAYFIEAIQKKGLVKGLYLGIRRLLKCHPFSKHSGYDPVQ